MTEHHLDSEKDKYISMEEACRLLESDQADVVARLRGQDAKPSEESLYGRR